MRVIRVPGIAETAIFVGVCPNAMFPYTYSATRSCEIDNLLLADERARRFSEAFYRSERADDIEIYPLVSKPCVYRKLLESGQKEVEKHERMPCTSVTRVPG